MIFSQYPVFLIFETLENLSSTDLSPYRVQNPLLDSLGAPQGFLTPSSHHSLILNTRYLHLSTLPTTDSPNFEFTIGARIFSLRALGRSCPRPCLIVTSTERNLNLLSPMTAPLKHSLTRISQGKHQGIYSVCSYATTRKAMTWRNIVGLKVWRKEEEAFH